MRALGFVLLALPFVAVAGFMTYALGLKATIFALGWTIAVVAAILAGAYLVFG